MAVLVVLVVISAVQAVQLTNLKEKINTGSLTTKSIGESSGKGVSVSQGSAPKNLQELPSMVGGC